MEKINRDRGRRSRKTLIGAFIVLGILLLACVSATILTYLGETSVTINVQQSIKIDGHNWNESVETDLGDVYAGCSVCERHTLTNDGCEGVLLDWDFYGEPDMEGIEVTMREAEPNCCNHILETLEVSVLDGQALNDDFEVYVDTILVYTYPAVSAGSETWINHVIDLIPYPIICCDSHTIEVRCTAPQPWSGHATYGQLAVDTISLYCENHVLCDTVDIGSPTSEAGHNLIGWGPEEPSTPGGGYGGITDCRTTWEPTDSSSNARGATVVLTCSDCYESNGCDDNSPIINLPFYLDANSEMDFCLCYELDPLLEPMEYTVYSRLIKGA